MAGKIKIKDIPEPGSSVPGKHDLVVAWVPYPVQLDEQEELLRRGAQHCYVGDNLGYFVKNSLGTIPHSEQVDLIELALAEIQKDPNKRYLMVKGSNEKH